MTEHIVQAQWEAFLDDVAKQHHGFNARIEILGRDFGDQDMAAWPPATAWAERPSLTGRVPCHCVGRGRPA
jgi:hypothetical protein